MNEKVNREYNAQSANMNLSKPTRKEGEVLVEYGIAMFNRYLLGVWARPRCDFTVGLENVVYYRYGGYVSPWFLLKFYDVL